jgi:MerR family transcriptional regulator, mercuric resistance operon regulatory protein
MASITVSRGRILTIGALSKLTGVNIETIRYYERINLMTKPPRTASGHRDYQPQHVERLRFVKRARELGFGIGDIRTLLILALSGSSSCAEARDVASAHLAEVRAKLDDLAKLEKVLAGTIKQCDTQCCRTLLPPCPILEALQG